MGKIEIGGNGLVDKPQSIFRIHRDSRDRFTLLDNRAIRDGRISFKATGILSFLLSLPDDWRVNIEHMKTVKPDGRDSVRAGFAELVEFGYVSKEVVRGDGGKIATTIWHVYESPKLDNPTSANPKLGFPTSANPPQRRNEEKEKPKETNESPMAPKGAVGSSYGTKMSGFEEFWKEYPKKKSKDDAKRAWARKGCASLIEEIMLALSLQKGWASWTKKSGQFIPYPASWINGKQWEDEEHAEPAKPTPPTRKGF